MCLAIPGEVLEIYQTDGVRYAQVRFGAVTREVCLHVQPDVSQGDFVLVHVGLAIATIDADEALRTWQLLSQLGEADESELGLS